MSNLFFLNDIFSVIFIYIILKIHIFQYVCFLNNNNLFIFLNDVFFFQITKLY